MPGVTKEQIVQAKEWDLLSYLQTYEPHELKRSGPNEYCTRTHDSLKISNGKWCWNSRGIGGRTALDYLIKVRGMDFVGAVEALCGYRAPLPQERPKPKPPKPFQLPEASRFPAAMLSYLQKRGIHPELLQACIQAGTLYESRKYQNCVFVGRDTTGRARFACLRGTRDNFRIDVEGSDKRYSFALLAGDVDCPRLAVAARGSLPSPFSDQLSVCIPWSLFPIQVIIIQRQRVRMKPKRRKLDCQAVGKGRFARRGRPCNHDEFPVAG